MTLRDAIEGLLGPHDDTPRPPAESLASEGHGELDPQLFGTALGHFADTAPIVQADALAPIVTRSGPIPFETGDLPDADLPEGADAYGLFEATDPAAFIQHATDEGALEPEDRALDDGTPSDDADDDLDDPADGFDDAAADGAEDTLDETTDADLTDADLTDADLTDGDLTDGDLADGDLAEVSGFDGLGDFGVEHAAPFAGFGDDLGGDPGDLTFDDEIDVFGAGEQHDTVEGSHPVEFVEHPVEHPVDDHLADTHLGDSIGDGFEDFYSDEPAEPSLFSVDFSHAEAEDGADPDDLDLDFDA